MTLDRIVNASSLLEGILRDGDSLLAQLAAGGMHEGLRDALWPLHRDLEMAVALIRLELGTELAHRRVDPQSSKEDLAQLLVEALDHVKHSSRLLKSRELESALISARRGRDIFRSMLVSLRG